MDERFRVALLTDDDVPAAVRIFTAAFAGAGMTGSITTDPGRAERMLRKEAAAHLKRSRRYGHVFGASEAGELRGFAIWLPHGVHVSDVVIPPLDVLPGVLRMIVRSRFGVPAFGARRGRAMARVGAGRWHLAFLVADPEHQGRGVGRRLLDHMLERLDADGASVWLECERPNVALYERFGFAVTDEVGGPRVPKLFYLQREGRPILDT